MMNNSNNLSELRNHFPELHQWVKSSIDDSSLKKKNLKFINFKSSETWGNKTQQIRLSYKIEIERIFYYDFLIDAIKIKNVNDNLLMLSGKYRYQKDYKPLIEEIYDKNSWLKIIKRIIDIEKEKKEIIDF